MTGGKLTMIEGGKSKAALAGKRVAFAGTFAAVTRDEAAELAAEAGAIPVAGAGDDTALLVVGEESWPVGDDGHVAAELERAGELHDGGGAIEMISESAFLTQVGISPPEETARVCTSEQLSRILHIPHRRLRAWIRRGLLKPVRTERRVEWFDFRQAAEIKRLAELTANGVSVSTLRESLARIARWMPETESAVARLEHWAGEARLLVHVGDGKLAEPTGQLRLLFEEDPEGAGPSATEAPPAPVFGEVGTTSFVRPIFGVIEGRAKPASPTPLPPATLTADEWFELALEYEDNEKLEEAARAYREALLVGGPSAEIAFNLGNVLYSLGRWEEALSRFEQAVEIDPEYVEAWNNLASVHAQFEEWDEAIEAGTRALEIAPDYPDAHYNLAEAYHASGRRADAVRHARAYLKSDAKSPWAKRLEQSLGLTGARP